MSHDAAIAQAQDAEDLHAAGLTVNWTGGGTRWSAHVDQAIRASRSADDLADFGYVVDDQ